MNFELKIKNLRLITN